MAPTLPLLESLPCSVASEPASLRWCRDENCIKFLRTWGGSLSKGISSSPSPSCLTWEASGPGFCIPSGVRPRIWPLVTLGTHFPRDRPATGCGTWTVFGVETLHSDTRWGRGQPGSSSSRWLSRLLGRCWALSWSFSIWISQEQLTCPPGPSLGLVLAGRGEQKASWEGDSGQMEVLLAPGRAHVGSEERSRPGSHVPSSREKGGWWPLWYPGRPGHVAWQTCYSLSSCADAAMVTGRASAPLSSHFHIL